MKFLLLAFIILLSACSTAPTSEQWPAGMPTQAYLKAYYDRDKAHQQALSQKGYFTWVYRFYNGWELYSRGWFQATQELVDSLETPEEKARGQALMEEIGFLVGPEWAKSDPYRSINTRLVGIWGNVILKGMATDNQFPLLYQIHSDVIQLLANDLTAKAIKKSRYMTDEVFADATDDDF